MRLLPNFSGRQKVPTVLASEAVECGLACLAMISAKFGGESDLGALRRKFSISLKGVTAKGMLTLASAMGLAARAVKAEPETASALKLPCILHWTMNHFVVLESVGRHKFVIVDPSIGRRVIGWEEFSDSFTGIAIEAVPSADWRSNSHPPRIQVSQVVGSVFGLKRAVAQLGLLALGLEVCSIAQPYFMQLLVDGAIASADVELLASLVVGFFSLVLIQASLYLVRGNVVTKFSADVNLQWLVNVFGHLQRLPVAFFEKRILGDIMAKFNSLPNIQRALSTNFIEIVIDGILAFSMLAMIFLFGGSIGFFPLVSALIVGLTRYAIFDGLRAKRRETLLHASRQQSQLIETLRGIQAIKLFNRADARQAAWLNHLVGQLNSEAGAQRHMIRQRGLAIFVGGTERLVFMGAAGLAAIHGTLSLGALFALAAYREQFASRVTALFDRLFELADIEVQLERLSDIALEPPEVRPLSEYETPPSSSEPPLIQLRDVSFSYSPLELPVVSNLSMTIFPGESVAITGTSGCGKTTLAKLILGVLTPTSGHVLMDGRSLHDIPPGDHRRGMTAVMQNDSLFMGTVLQNITFFDYPPDFDRAVQCARSAAIHEDIEQMPMKYQTYVGDMGSAISGGQKQRLLLARALYSRPRVLVLDEATSQLDVANEALVNEAIARLNLTRIVIAHRPETIRSATRVVEMVGGRIASSNFQ